MCTRCGRQHQNTWDLNVVDGVQGGLFLCLKGGMIEKLFGNVRHFYFFLKIYFRECVHKWGGNRGRESSSSSPPEPEQGASLGGSIH